MANWPAINLQIKKDYKGCFACGSDNPVGLKLKFRNDNGTARTEYTPVRQYQGWDGILHGGITLVILDEAMSYATMFAGKSCVTAQMESRLNRMIKIGETLVISGTVTKQNRKLLKTFAQITLKDGTVAAEATGTHFVINDDHP